MLLSLLKQETRSYHRILETQVDFDACLASPASWRWLLETFYGYCSPIETALFSSREVGEWLTDFRLRRRARLLSRDIEALGGDARRVPICLDLPSFDSLAERFGGLYVMEGSTLGGQIISRMAVERGYTHERGCGYFASYGDNVGPMWNTFGEQLEKYGAAHMETQAEMIQSAIETFKKFDSWITRRKCEFVGDDHRHVSKC